MSSVVGTGFRPALIERRRLIFGAGSSPAIPELSAGASYIITVPASGAPLSPVRRALQVAALPDSWKDYFRERLERV